MGKNKITTFEISPEFPYFTVQALEKFQKESPIRVSAVWLAAANKIMSLILIHSGLSLQAVCSQNRSKIPLRMRYLFIYFMVTRSHASMSAAMAFLSRDHSTGINAVKKLESLLLEDVFIRYSEDAADEIFLSDIFVSVSVGLSDLDVVSTGNGVLESLTHVEARMASERREEMKASHEEKRVYGVPESRVPDLFEGFFLFIGMPELFDRKRIDNYITQVLAAS